MKLWQFKCVSINTIEVNLQLSIRNCFTNPSQVVSQDACAVLPIRAMRAAGSSVEEEVSLRCFLLQPNHLINSACWRTHFTTDTFIFSSTDLFYIYTIYTTQIPIDMCLPWALHLYRCFFKCWSIITFLYIKRHITSHFFIFTCTQIRDNTFISCFLYYSTCYFNFFLFSWTINNCPDIIGFYGNSSALADRTAAGEAAEWALRPPPSTGDLCLTPAVVCVGSRTGAPDTGAPPRQDGQETEEIRRGQVERAAAHHLHTLTRDRRELTCRASTSDRAR